MSDVVFLVVTVVAFALMALLVGLLADHGAER